MARVTVYHLTLPKRLPLIEEDGLRTRADLSELYGPPGELDQAAPGTYANGKRVSGWTSLEHARGLTDELGSGLVSYTVDPAKTLANRASARDGKAAAYWESARTLREWQEDGELPEDLEVHQNLPVRVKYLTLLAPLATDEQLGAYAPLVHAIADEDRLSAKALMHLLILIADDDFDSEAFTAACALAWRDTPDPASLLRELREMDPDKVVSAALAEHGGLIPDLAPQLREVLEETREWADENGMEHGEGLFARAAVVLDELPEHAA